MKENQVMTNIVQEMYTYVSHTYTLPSVSLHTYTLPSVSLHTYTPTYKKTHRYSSSQTLTDRHRDSQINNRRHPQVTTPTQTQQIISTDQTNNDVRWLEIVSDIT